ncbi:MAG: M3 family metallopeptidase [Rikenellaceae bacterium]|nr:M3 family metallopeptidase [Rikenellaceae bacterium]
MKKITTTLMAIFVITAASSQDNPLLKEFDTPHGTPPFDEIELEHYLPAVEEGLRQAREELRAIVENPEAPTFKNTIEALENSGGLLNKVLNIFYPLTSSNTSEQMEALSFEIQPLLTEYSNDVSLNPVLFERVKAVYLQKDDLDLDTEQAKLLENTYKDFTRSGADLGDKDKARYRELTTELGNLSLKFAQNALAATNSYTLNIPPSDAAKVEYMPEFVKAAMAAEARSRGEEGWTVTLQAPSYGPFLTYSNERDLKEKLWMKSNAKCNEGDQLDNKATVRRIVEIRKEIANLLGYRTYADYILDDRMAGSRENVENFLSELLTSTRQWAVEDFEEVARFASTVEGAPEKLMPWDFAYYNEKLVTDKYAFNEEIIKPYLQLENVEKGTFLLAEKLYGVTFRENPDIQVYHPDVKVFEVYDRDGSFLSVLYMDYFPRESKRSGAWMTSFRDMYTTEDGTEVRPFVTLNFNFTKPTDDAPSLLNFTELTTMLHEFGHGLHGMLAKGKYHSITGTGVYRDFVELPSQILENWATEKQFLDLFAVHYQTGEKIPDDIIEKLIRSKNHLEAYSNVRQVSLGLIDMAWHTLTGDIPQDVEAFEKQSIAQAQILPDVPGTCISPSFSHIFAGGYATGYYGYKWAEVLEADAFSLFKENGIFDRETAESFRRNILEKGGTEHPMTLYVRFRGHEPQTAALIEKIGEGRKE